MLITGIKYDTHYVLRKYYETNFIILLLRCTLQICHLHLLYGHVCLSYDCLRFTLQTKDLRQASDVYVAAKYKHSNIDARMTVRPR